MSKSLKRLSTVESDPTLVKIELTERIRGLNCSQINLSAKVTKGDEMLIILQGKLIFASRLACMHPELLSG